VASKPVTGRAEARRLVVREGEDPWTKDELAEVRAQLRADVKRLTAELEMVEEDLVGLMRSSGEGAGNDQADVGSATFERDQELTIANNARDMLVQSQHALDRIGNGSYGVCEVCGEPIGKNRLMVFPRATMCMSCKQREERR
jgi:DnaK suppressor protein